MTPQEEIEMLKAKLKLYEQNGAAKLYYSLNRKANEMADLLNKVNLSTITLDDPKDKTFDRMKVVWNDAASISQAIQGLGMSIGATGDEKKDVDKRPFLDRIADKRD